MIRNNKIFEQNKTNKLKITRINKIFKWDKQPKITKNNKIFK